MKDLSIRPWYDHGDDDKKEPQCVFDIIRPTNNGHDVVDDQRRRLRRRQRKRKLRQSYCSKTASASSTTVPLLHVLLLILVIMSINIRPTYAAISCTSDEYCQTTLGRDGSFCRNGMCSNPFVNGCLSTMLGESSPSSSSAPTATADLYSSRHRYHRICNSDDDNNDDDSSSSTNTTTTSCRRPFDDMIVDVDGDVFQYPEVRIHNGDWESSIFYAWIMQIVLMEVLEVPATVGLTTSTTAASSFYSPTNTIEYSSSSYPFDALLKTEDKKKERTTSSSGGGGGPGAVTSRKSSRKDSNIDCRLAVDENGDEVPCVHVLPEVWNGQQKEWTDAVRSGVAEPVEGNGGVGKGSWFVPAFTARGDDSLVSFYGLQGESNRHKLASSFGKPTTWGEYCDEVSPTKCFGVDNDEGSDRVVATRPPTTDEERNLYFHPDNFQGHFRFDTPSSDCTSHPTNCTGFIVGPPCSWSTNIDSQLYWNDIKLTPAGPSQPNGGYEYARYVIQRKPYIFK
jgi:hypothetical protein